jgi:site-specific recombinase XerD
VPERPASATGTDYVAAFARFLSRQRRGWRPVRRAARHILRAPGHLATWLAWCRGVDLDVAAATTEHVEDYREALLAVGCLPHTRAIKLTLVRRLYDAAVRDVLRHDNPAFGVRPPRSKPTAKISDVSARAI